MWGCLCSLEDEDLPEIQGNHSKLLRFREGCRWRGITTEEYKADGTAVFKGQSRLASGQSTGQHQPLVCRQKIQSPLLRTYTSSTALLEVVIVTAAQGRVSAYALVSEPSALTKPRAQPLTWGRRRPLWPPAFRSVSDILRTELVGKNGESCKFHVRYFEVAPGGYSTLEKHVHEHVVIPLRGKGVVRDLQMQQHSATIRLTP